MWVKTQAGGLVNLEKFKRVESGKLRGGKESDNERSVVAISSPTDYEILFKGKDDQCDLVMRGIELGLAGKSNKCDVMAMAILGAGF